jgi:hypothetical protein
MYVAVVVAVAAVAVAAAHAREICKVPVLRMKMPGGRGIAAAVLVCCIMAPSKAAAAGSKKIPNDAVYCVYADDEGPRAFANLEKVCNIQNCVCYDVDAIADGRAIPE